MNFSEYLVGKKIDERAFAAGDAATFQEWKMEFEQMHANSFTVQKLNLINPIRRKYTLKQTEAPTPSTEQKVEGPMTTAAPKVAKPVFKPKPKL